MRAHLLQTDIVWEDKPANRARVQTLVRGAGVAPGDMIVLPEMFETGFSLNVDATHDNEGEGARWLSDLARAHGAYVVGGVTMRAPDGKGRNRAFCVAPSGEPVASYDKLHPFSYGREGERFLGGDRVRTFAWRAHAGDEGALIVQPTICYDLRFPELYRAGRAMGAHVVVVIANWPAARTAHWRALLTARAIENQACVIGVNRCGRDPHLAYDGASMVIGPKGETLGDAGADEGVLSVEIDPGAIHAWRAEFPAWRDARAAILPRLGPDGHAPLGGPEGA